ncbi:MAG: transposase [Candidatus Omnitrophota bacterium]
MSNFSTQQYCPMPTHVHLVLKQLQSEGVSKFMCRILQGYSTYFNRKHGRKGPLWESRFKTVLVRSQEQFSHLTRYIHLNPVTSYLVDKPEDWSFSSYREYLGICGEEKKICNFKEYLNMNPKHYKKFVEDQIDYQRELSKMKNAVSSTGRGGNRPGL